jgi:hypothetical protein
VVTVGLRHDGLAASWLAAEKEDERRPARSLRRPYLQDICDRQAIILLTLGFVSFPGRLEVEQYVARYLVILVKKKNLVVHRETCDLDDETIFTVLHLVATAMVRIYLP